MNRQDKIKLDSASYQNIFLLSKNKAFITDIKVVADTYSREIKALKKDGALNKLLAKEIGSEGLLDNIDRIAKKSELYKTPDRTMLYILVILSVLGVDPIPTILYFDKNKVPFVNPIHWEIDSGSEGVALTISLSNFHTKTDLIKFIEKHWDNDIEKVRTPFKKATAKIEKPKPIKDFARDWQIYQDKENMTNYQLVEKYKLNDISSVSMAVSRIKAKINSLYKA